MYIHTQKHTHTYTHTHTHTQSNTNTLLITNMCIGQINWSAYVYSLITAGLK